MSQYLIPFSLCPHLHCANIWESEVGQSKFDVQTLPCIYLWILNSYLILWFEPCGTSSSCHIKVASSAYFFKFALVNKLFEFTFSHAVFVTRQYQGVTTLRQNLSAGSIGAKRCLKYANALSSALFVARTAFSNFFVANTAPAFVTVHAEKALWVVGAPVVELNAIADARRFATIYSLEINTRLTTWDQIRIFLLLNQISRCILGRGSWEI